MESMVKSKSALISGADGFIGSNLVYELLKNDYQIYAVVLNEELAKDKLGDDPKITYIECDMDHYGKLLNDERLKNVSYIFHFAWAGVSDEKSSDYTIQLNNVKCACQMMDIAVALKIDRFIFADSIMEYEHKKSFENRMFDVSLRNTYHVAKIAARNLLQLRAMNIGIEFLPVLISNVYGVGECSPRLINTAIRKLIKKEHMSFTSSEQLYDFIYIDDAVRAIRLVAEQGISNKEYYIGNKTQKKLKEYLYIMRDIIAPEMELGIGELPLKGISLDYSEFDTCGLYDDFNFEVMYTFKKGIEKTSEWMKEKCIDSKKMD